MSRQYRFVTIWKVKSSRERVWEKIYGVETWDQWWRAIAKVSLIRQGDPDSGLGNLYSITWRTALPYQVHFEGKSVKIEPFERIELEAKGELEGYGCWTFSQEGEICVVRYDWEVITNKWWMNTFYFLLKRFFLWNHNQVMAWGGQGLAKSLNSEVCEIIHA